MKGDDLADRLLDFAVRTIKLVAALPKTTTGKHIGRQFLRAGTSVGANYEEGRAAESRADFIHKLGIAWKEIRESRYWLRVIHRVQFLRPSRVEPLLQEAEELCAILSKSLETARKNMPQRK
jgi:four helix bundle protein